MCLCCKCSFFWFHESFICCNWVYTQIIGFCSKLLLVQFYVTTCKATASQARVAVEAQQAVHPQRASSWQNATRYMCNLSRPPKRQFYQECRLYRVARGLLKAGPSNQLLKDMLNQDLVEAFNGFFVKKITHIQGLRGPCCNSSGLSSSRWVTWTGPFRTHNWEGTWRNIGWKKAMKLCDLDPIPYCMVKKNLDVLLLTLISIVNRSLPTSTFPAEMKTALIKALFQKPTLDIGDKKNYRSVWNLAFLGKVIEKIVGWAHYSVYMEHNHHVWVNAVGIQMPP